MALQFQPPPDWLLKDYMDSKNRNPVTEGLNAAIPVAQLYLQQKNLGTQNALLQRSMNIKEQELALQKEKAAREQDTHFREYNPAGLAGAGGAYNKYSTQDMGEAQGPALTGDAQLRSLLTQSGGQATLGANMGPALPQKNELANPSPVIEHWNSGFGMNQNASLAKAPQNPQEEANLQFANEFPLGSNVAKIKKDLPQEIPLFNKKGDPIRANTKSGLLPPNSKVIDDTEGRGGQFVGTQGNMGTYWDPNTNSFGQTPLPAGGPLNPRIAPTIPGGEVSKFGDLENLLTKVGELRKAYKPEFTGPAQGVGTNIRQFTGFGASDERGTFVQITEDISDILLRARSGGAITNEEYNRLTKIVPSRYRSDVDFEAKMNRFENALKETLASKQGAFQKAGYRTPDFSSGQSTPTELPSVGGTFQGGKVLSIKKVR